jgi:hypothetical protein
LGVVYIREEDIDADPLVAEEATEAVIRHLVDLPLY